MCTGVHHSGATSGRTGLTHLTIGNGSLHAPSVTNSMRQGRTTRQRRVSYAQQNPRAANVSGPHSRRRGSRCQRCHCAESRSARPPPRACSTKKVHPQPSIQRARPSRISRKSLGRQRAGRRQKTGRSTTHDAICLCSTVQYGQCIGTGVTNVARLCMTRWTPPTRTRNERER